MIASCRSLILMLRSAPRRLVLVALAGASVVAAQNVRRDLPYAEPPNPRQMLDVHAPAGANRLPVVFWIHGGGWQNGDKSEMHLKPAAFVSRGLVFVATNYRFRPHVPMEDIVRDIARSLRWVHANIAAHGGDPQRLLVMGHSAGAQLAALVCTDDRYLRAEGLSLEIIKGCVPVDGDTYDVPLIIATARARRQALGQPEPKFGHREKFGDPEHQAALSAVNHVARGKGIPPFLLIHVANHPDTTAQAERLHAVLAAAGVPATLFGGRDTDHIQINRRLGQDGDPPTAALFDFVGRVLRP